MAGLLDSKTRVMDARLTSRGRDSLASGGLEVKYVSFSDIGATYEDDGSGIAVDPLPIGFETFSTQNDEITVTSDEFGDLNSFSGNGYEITRSGKANQFLSSDAVTELIYSGSIESFDNQRLISTSNVLFEDPGLSIQPSELTFTVSDTSPFEEEPASTSIDDVETLFADKRLANSIKFRYLPPIQRTITTVGNEVELGSYADVREEDLTEDEILATIADLESGTLLASKYTDQHEIGIQLFESSSSGLAKLDIIRYGELSTRGESGKIRTLYFIGKVFEDGYGNPTFVNLFDLVIE